MKRLKAELEESRMEAERFRASSQYEWPAQCPDQTSRPAAPHRICSDCNRSLEWPERQPVEEELWLPTCICASPRLSLCLPGREGATFAAEVALRTLERRPLPCGHHHWSRPALSAGTGHALHISGRDTGGG